jgi:diguanylate cyclase (GGDEF)-like protein
MRRLEIPGPKQVPLEQEDRNQVYDCIEHYRAWVANSIQAPLAKSLGGITPVAILGLLRLLKETAEHVARDWLYEKSLPEVRRAIAHERKSLAEKNEELLFKVSDPGVRKQIQDPMDRLTGLISSPWFVGDMPKAPRLTDFLTIKEAYSLLKTELTPPPIEYDEKFGLLIAPGQFLPRLAMARREAVLRDTITGVAFVDIDNFKAFNSRHREDQVDLHVLPRFMSSLEAHVHSHGYAFRFGGDEYMVLLPNTSREFATSFLHHLQEKVAALKFLDPEDKMTVSIGLTTASPQSLLTDRELQQRANVLKERAKEDGKDRIAWADGDALALGDVEVSAR